VSDPNPFFRTAFEECSSNTSPLVGVELTVSEVSLQTTSEIPEGDLAVLPVVVEAGSPLTLTLSLPLQEIAPLGRRMLGAEDPDKKKEELTPEVLDAIGELLNLMSGGIDKALRTHLRPDVGGRPDRWWRTDEPDDEKFEEGEFLIGQTTLSQPEGTPVHLCLRVPATLFEDAEREDADPKSLGRVLLLGLGEETGELFQKTLTDAGVEFDGIDPEDPNLLELVSNAGLVVLNEESGLELCRRFRTSNKTWQVPTVVCVKEPSRERVLEALDCGASHVLRVPCEGIDLLRVLQCARRANQEMEESFNPEG
jgi:CheY-like chemotaxis protein